MKKQNEFRKMLNSMNQEDIDFAQEQDFDSRLYRLMEFPQGLYDMLHTESDPEWNDLTEVQIKDRLATLDTAYVYLQAAMEDISMVLREKYPDDMKKKHNRINF